MTRLCEWGDCQNTNCVVTLNYRKEERPGFCSTDHAALWLIARGRQISDGRTLLLNQIETALEKIP